MWRFAFLLDRKKKSFSVLSGTYGVNICFVHGNAEVADLTCSQGPR